MPEQRGRSPVRRWTLGALGLAVVGLAAYDAAVVWRLRRGARPAPLTHDGRLGPQEGRPLRLAVLGDSAAAGHGLRNAARAFPRCLADAVSARLDQPVELACHAVDGARTADLARSQAPAIAGQRWDVVVCSAGVNDALAARSPHRVHRDTTDLVRAVRAAAPDALAVVVGCPDLGAAPGLPWPLRAVVGWSCRRVADAQAQAVARTPATFVPLPAGIGADMFGDDGVHPGAAGQLAVARLTADAIATEARWTSD